MSKPKSRRTRSQVNRLKRHAFKSKSQRMRDVSLGYDLLEARKLLAVGVGSNDCAPNLDLSGMPSQTVVLGQTLTIDLLNSGATLVDQNSDGSPTGDAVRFQLDPDRPDDAPLGATITDQGVFTWTPSTNQVGTFDVVVIAIDGGSPALADAEVFSVEVTQGTADNNAPNIFAIADQSATVGQELSVQVTANDVDSGDTLTFSLDPEDAPANATLTQNSNTTATITWTPQQSDLPGPQLFRVLVTDNGEPALGDSESFQVTLEQTATNTAPIISAIQDQTATVGTQLVVEVSASDSDTEDVLTFSLVTDNGSTPESAIIQRTSNGTATIRWTPELADVGSPVPFRVRVEDDGTPVESDGADFEVTVSASATTQLFSESAAFSQSVSQSVELGQAEGTRTIAFNLEAAFDRLDTAPANEDVFQVFLVDPNDPAQTLLDNGKSGTAVFSLAGDKAEYQPGLVRFDGSRVEIDVTSLGGMSSAALRFQVINSDSDDGTQIGIGPVTSITNPDALPVPVLPSVSNPVAPNAAVDLATFTATDDVEIQVQNVMFDEVTGAYSAELIARNNGPAIGRRLAVSFADLPAGVTFTNASGTTATDDPYVNFNAAIGSGGLASGKSTRPVLIELSNPTGIRFSLIPTALSGGENSAPTLGPIAAITAVPGDVIQLQLDGQDSDGDTLIYSLSSTDFLPGGMLMQDGRLMFQPAPGQQGTYDFTVTVSDGAETVSQSSSITVETDPVTSTRFSGTILDTDETAIANLPIEIRDAAGVTLLTTTTDAEGEFSFDSVADIAADTVVVRGDLAPQSDATDPIYPFIAEKLPLVLGHEVYLNAKNVIFRPIYLPALDVAGGTEIDPSINTTVDQEIAPGEMASVFVEANSLKMDDGSGNMVDFTGTLSITEVPASLTPASLPVNLIPDTVVTIQPGEMLFTSPAELSLPNRSGFSPGTVMDLWSINPETGDFENVGQGQVTADGSLIETISGGINNSSWHFFAPPPPPNALPPGENPSNPEENCTCAKAAAGLTSEVELHSGALSETHDLVSYQSLGETRGLQFYYNSLEADPQPILRFGYENIQPNDPRFLIAELEVMRGDFMYQLPGYVGGNGLDGGEHFWTLPTEGGDIEAALQVDLAALPSGIYDYVLRNGLFTRSGDGQFSGTSVDSTGTFVITNSVASPFGSGWSLAGQHHIVENPNGTVLLMDGAGTRYVFDPDPEAPGQFLKPPGDFSTLELLNDGTYRRTMTDQTAYQFNERNQLATMTDRNGRVTTWQYATDGRLEKWIDPANLETVLGYSNDRVSSITDPSGRVTELEYDSSGNLTKITDPDGSERTFGYDNRHRMTSEINQRGFNEETTYGFAGRVNGGLLKDGSERFVMPTQTQVLLPATDTIDANNAPVASSPKEAMAMYSDENGSVVEVRLDQFGQAVTSVDSEGALPRTSRDTNNLVTISGDGRGNVTSFEYDENGNVTTIRDTIAGTGEQLLSNAGTNFWVAFQSNAGGTGTERSLFVSAPQDTSGTVSVPGINFSEPFSVIAGEITTISLPNNAVTLGSDQIGRLGINVTAQSPVSVYGLNQQQFTTDGFLALPVEVLGREYLVMAHGGGNLTQFAVVATEDNTEVTITPSNTVGARVVGVPYSITLQEGETYQLQGTELTGTVITSDTPVAVFSGHDCGVVPANSSACDHLVEQLPPTDTWGQAFVTVPLATRQNGDTFRILAASDDTEVFINGILVSTINRGEFYEQIVTESSTITATKPVLVAQFSNGTSFDNVTADPFMAIVPPFEQFTNSATISTPATGIASNFINVVAPNDAVGLIRLDGEVIPAEQFQAIGGSGFSGTQIPVELGTHSLESPIAFGALAYGFDDFDSYGYLGGQAFSPGASRSFTYDPVFNQLTSATDELGRQTIYEVDPSNGNRLAVQEVVGEIDSDDNGETDDVINRFTYTPLGLVDTATDPLGRITDFDYNIVGQLTDVTFAAGTVDEASQNFEYNTAGNQTVVVDENGNRTEFTYDDLNRLLQITEPDPDGAGPLTSPITNFSYDNRGNLLTTTDSRGNITTNSYDPMDRLATTDDSFGQTTTFAYDEAGNLASVTDPLGFSTQNIYDGRNRLVETIDPEGGVTQFTYDSDDNLSSLTDPVGNLTQFRYDARDRLVQEIDPLGAVTNYVYDAADNLTRKTDRNGRVTEFVYDELDRLIEEMWLGDDGTTAENAIDYAYDKAGNLLQVDDVFSGLGFTYDNRDRVQTVDNAGTPNTPNVVLTYAYDGVGNVLSVTDSIDGDSGATTAYDYDRLNRTTSIQQSGPSVSDKVVDFTYNELGQFDEIARYSDLTRTNLVAASDYEYDELNRLIDLDHTNSADGVLAFYNFEYDPSSRITKITDIDGVTDYSYDDRSQLTGAERDAGDARGDEFYAYDENGNRTDSHLHDDGYVTGDGNRLSSDGTYEYEYDDEGNMTKRTEIETEDYREFDWDHRNRLIRVTDFSSGGIATQEVEFSYDSLDRRIAKTVDDDGAGAGGEDSTIFVYDREDVLFDFVDEDGLGQLESSLLDQRYLHGPGIDNVLAQEDNELHWLLKDHLGTIRDMVANDAVVVNHFVLDTFGGILIQTNLEIETRYVFTGREYDSEINLFYFRARYYDSSIGRFVGDDPLGVRGIDKNLYRYAANQPNRFVDPTGRETESGPSFATLLSNLNTESRKKLFEALGGGFPNLLDNPNFENTCALRLSDALNQSGMPIRSQPGLDTLIDGQGNRLATRAQELANVLSSDLGQPVRFQTSSSVDKLDAQKALAGQEGIIFFKDGWTNGVDHIDLWDGSQTGGTNGFTQGTPDEVWFWPIKD